jgi:hypothetical protein
MGMEDKNVYYINLFPYVHYLEWNIMIDRFWDDFKHNISESITKEFFKSQMLTCINRYNVNVERKSSDEYDAEKVVSMRIIEHLKEFFSDELKHNTPRRKEEPKNKTRRKKKI